MQKLPLRNFKRRPVQEWRGSQRRRKQRRRPVRWNRCSSSSCDLSFCIVSDLASSGKRYRRGCRSSYRHRDLASSDNLCGTVYQKKRDLKQHKKADHAKKNNSSSTSTEPDGKVVTAARSRSRAERNRALLVRTANDE